MSMRTEKGDLLYIKQSNLEYAVLHTKTMRLSFPCKDGENLTQAVRREIQEMRERAAAICERSNRIESALEEILAAKNEPLPVFLGGDWSPE